MNPTSISLSCPSCSVQLKVKSELAGKKLKCPKCKATVTVPGAPESVQMTNPDANTGVRPDRHIPETLVQGPGESPYRKPTRPVPVELTEGMETEAEEEVVWDFLAPPEQLDEIGRLGGYRVLEVLGHGGMGVVFKAEDPGLQRLVALKAMLPAMAASPSARKRFLREARAAAALKHDHIVGIYQVGEDRGAPYLAMEFLNGEPLDAKIERAGRVPLPEALRIARQIADGLTAAHERGLIHRDIKPANIWLESGVGQAPGSEGRAKILDFGLARSQEDDKNLTQAGSIVGTPAYMAPQQATGDKVDHRCDLFSLGCVLYRMCTGELPFKGNNSIAILCSLTSEIPKTPAELDVPLPPEVSALIMRLLAKNPDDRPATAREVADTLRAMERSLAAPAPPKKPAAPTQKPVVKKIEDATVEVKKPAKLETPAPPPPEKKEAPPPRRRLGLIAGAVGALALLVAGIVFLLPAGKGTIRVEVNDPDIKVAVDGGDFESVGDGKDFTVAPGEHGLRIKQGDTEFETDKIAVEKGATAKLKVTILKGKLEVVGADGKVLASRSTSSPPVVKGGSPLDNLDPAKIFPENRRRWQPKELVAVLGDHHRWTLPNNSDLVLSPDGKWLAVCSGPDFQLYETATMRMRWDAHDFKGTSSWLCAAFPLGGKHLFLGGKVWDISGEEPKAIAAQAQEFQNPQRVAAAQAKPVLAASYEGGFVRVFEFAEGALRLRREFKALEPGAQVSDVRPETQIQVGFADPDGRTLATKHGNRFKVWDTSVDPPKELGAGDADVIAVGPDGRTLAASHKGQIALWNLGATPPKPIPNWTVKGSIGYGDGMAFSPDGKKLMVAQGGKTDFWSVTPEAGAPLSTASDVKGYPAVSSDGKLLYVLVITGELRIFDAKGAGWEERPRPHGPLGKPFFSPDGSRLVTQSSGYNGSVTTLWDLSGASPVEKAVPESVRGGFALGWRGTGIVLFRDDRLWQWKGEGEPTLLTELGTGCNPARAWLSRDGRRLVVQREVMPGQQTTEIWDLKDTPPSKTASLEKVPVASNAEFSADGRKLMFGGHSAPSRLFVLDGTTWKEAWVSTETTRNGASIIPAGDRVVTTFLDKNTIWDTSSLPPRILHELADIPHCYSTDFSPDGRSLAISGACTPPVQIWDVAAGKRREGWAFPVGAGFSTFAPDNRHLAVQHGHGCIWILRLKPPTEPAGKE